MSDAKSVQDKKSNDETSQKNETDLIILIES